MLNYKLCYIDASYAFFTTAELKDQWGDDWDDSPFEHNSGDPYEWDENSGIDEYYVKKIVFESDMIRPEHGHCNSPYSVEKINAKHAPWLRNPPWEVENVVIFAGTSIDDFIKIVEEGGGTIYVPRKCSEGRKC